MNRVEPAKNNFDKLKEVLKPKKKIITSLFGFLLLAASVGAGVYIVGLRQNQKSRAAGVNLSLTSSSSSIRTNDTFNVTVGMNTNGLSVSGADITLRYDTSKLEAQSIQPSGSFLPVVFIPGTIDLTSTSSGRARIVLGCLTDTTGTYPKSGVSAIAVITFKAKAVGSSDVTFDATTAVASIGQTVNTVGTLTPLTVTVTTGSSVTPSPTPTKSPSPTPTKSPTMTPTASPSRSPSPTPTKSPTPIACVPNNGDANGDDKIDLADLAILQSHYGQTTSNGPSDGDFNCDGKVDAIDNGIWTSNYNGPTPTASPAGKPGDVNGDGSVNIIDIGLIIDNYGKLPILDTRTDLNKDGVVNIIDIGIVIDYYGK